jgi:hypothetical protein
MKYILATLFAVLLTACGHVIEYNMPDMETSVKVRRTSNSLIIKHTQYGGFYTLPINGLGAKSTPTRENTAPYEKFTKTSPQALDGQAIELKVRWVTAKNEAGRLVIRYYDGNRVTEGPAVYLLNVDDYHRSVFGYALVTPGEEPLVFYIKPIVMKYTEPSGVPIN